MLLKINKDANERILTLLVLLKKYMKIDHWIYTDNCNKDENHKNDDDKNATYVIILICFCYCYYHHRVTKDNLPAVQMSISQPNFNFVIGKSLVAWPGNES